MKFDAETLQLFLEEIPFYKNSECFCLGETLTEAGEIVKRIVEQNEKGE